MERPSGDPADRSRTDTIETSATPKRLRSPSIELYRFAAFICYARSDEPFARRLHRFLERYAIPKRVGTFDLAGRPNRIAPVFRDRDEIGSGNLGDAIEAALRASGALIVVCSPDAARSEWVRAEIAYYVSLGRTSRIFAVIARGEPDAAKAAATNSPPCIPAELTGLHRPGADGRRDELLAADARPQADGLRMACLKVVAGLIDVSLGTLVDRDRQARRRRRMAGLAIVGAVTCVALAAYGLTSARSRADAWRKEARLRITNGEPYRAGRFAVAGVADASNARKWIDPPNSGVPLIDTGLPLNARLILGDAFAMREHKLLSSGRWLLVKNQEDVGSLWDVDRGVRVAELGVVLGWQTTADERFLAVRSPGDQVSFWDISTGRRIGTSGPPGSGRSVNVSAKFGFAVTMSQRRICTLWNLEGALPIARLGPCAGVTLPDDVPFIMMRRPDRTGILWDRNGHAVVELVGRDSCEACIVSSDARWVVGLSGNRVSFIDTDGRHVARRNTLRAGYDRVANTGDGRRIVVLDQSGMLSLWDPATAKRVADLDMTDADHWYLSKTKLQAAIWHEDGTGGLWDVKTGRRLVEFPEGVFNHGAFSKSGTVLVALGNHGNVSIWDPATGERKANLPATGDVSGIEVSSDGKLVAVASSRSPGFIWSIDGDRKITEFDRPGADLDGKFSADSSRYVTSSAALAGDLWDARAGRFLGRLGGEGAVIEFEMSDDGTRLLTVTAYYSGAVWDVPARSDDDARPPRDLACSRNYAAIGPFDAEERRTFRLGGMPWHPCDWRGFLSSEGLAQALRRLVVDAGLGRDYVCGEVDAAGHTTPESLRACLSTTTTPAS